MSKFLTKTTRQLIQSECKAAVVAVMKKLCTSDLKQQKLKNVEIGDHARRTACAGGGPQEP